MPHTTHDEPREGLVRPQPGVMGETEAQQQIVLVVGRSPVNLVVLARIAERARMRPVTEAPERAGGLVERLSPSVIVLDGGADLHECDAVLGPIEALRRFGDRRPYVILLTPNNHPPQDVADSGLFDALVAKPVTPDRLQPMIEAVRDASVSR